MNKFTTIDELRLEKQKLYLKKEFLEDEIEQDFVEFRESLNPFNMIKGMFQKKISKSDPAKISPLTVSAGSAMLDLLLTGILFNKSSLMKKFVSSSLIRALGPMLVTKAIPVVTNFIHDLTGNSSRNNKANFNNYEQSTASEIY